MNAADRSRDGATTIVIINSQQNNNNKRDNDIKCLRLEACPGSVKFAFHITCNGIAPLENSDTNAVDLKINNSRQKNNPFLDPARQL